VAELESQQEYIKDIDPEKEEVIKAKKVQVEERFVKMLEPLQERRTKLERAKRLQQFLRDLQDEKLWISEKMPQATSTEYGTNLLGVQMLQRRNKSLRNEIDGHEPQHNNIMQLGHELIDEGHPQAEEFQQSLDELERMWQDLLDAVESRRKNLALSEVAQQYLFDASEAEAWMSEQELYMMAEERAKDEVGANNMLKKHSTLEKTVEDYADTIRELGERSRNLIDENHPDRCAFHSASQHSTLLCPLLSVIKLLSSNLKLTSFMPV
jgi:spectrin beta